MIRRLLALAGWCGMLTAGLLLLHRTDMPMHPDAPETVAIGMVRTAGLALGWYLVVATAVGSSARLAGSLRLVRATDLVVVPSLRRLLNTVVGASAALASATPAAWAQSPEHAEEPPPATILRMADDRRTTGPAPSGGLGTLATTTTTTSASSPVEEQEPSPPPAPAATTAEPAPPPDPVPTPRPPFPPPPEPPGPAATTTVPPSTWTVAAGDHFWSIAERVLAAAWQRPPTDLEVDPYWRSLVDSNRTRLAVPGDADLLFTGQELTVPVPPRPPP